MKLNGRYACVQGFFWMQYGAVSGFSSIFLLGRGFSNTRIGMIIAASGACSAVLQPVVAGYADRPDSPSLKRIAGTLAALLLVTSALLLWAKGGWICGLVYGAGVSVLQLITPLVNALGMESINQGREINFGLARGIGSGAYAALAYGLGILVERAGVGVIPFAMLAAVLCFLLALHRFPFQKAAKTVGGKGGMRQNPISFFRSYPQFSVVLAGCVFVYMSHMLTNSFMYQVAETKGGGSAETGFLMALAAMLELPTMFLFSYMVKKVRCHIWFRCSGIFFMLKALGTLLAPSILALCAVQLLQMFSFALIMVSSVYYVNSIMEEQDAIKGQAYMTMTHTLGCVLGALLGGGLIDRAGVTAMLAAAVGMAALGMVILLLAAERGRDLRKEMQ